MLYVKGLDIYISRGDTEDLLIEFEDEVPPDNTNVLIALKRYPNNSPPLWEKYATIRDGEFHLIFNSSDTDFSPGVYNWDMTLLYENGEVYHPMNPARFEISRVVSKYISNYSVVEESNENNDINNYNQCFCKRIKISIRHSMESGSVTVNQPTIDDTTGLITATATIVPGYVNGGTEQNTLQLPVQIGRIIIPTRSEQTAIAPGYYAIGDIKVSPIPDSYYLLEEIFPVGCVFATVNPNDPSDILGFGTWLDIGTTDAVWRQLRNKTWGNIRNGTWNIKALSIDGVYVYRRIL